MWPPLQWVAVKGLTCVGSWRWPFSRKDAALYGDRGFVITSDDRHYAVRTEK